MKFLWIQERTESWISALRRRLAEITQSVGENGEGKKNTVDNPDGVTIAVLLGAERSDASRKRGRYEQSPSTAEIALWQLLLLK